MLAMRIEKSKVISLFLRMDDLSYLAELWVSAIIYISELSEILLMGLQ